MNDEYWFLSCLGLNIYYMYVYMYMCTYTYVYVYNQSSKYVSIQNFEEREVQGEDRMVLFDYLHFFKA